MKYTIVKMSEIAKHPTMRLDAKYWIKKKEKSYKQQAASLTACPRDDRMNSNPLWTLDLSGGRSNGSGPVT